MKGIDYLDKTWNPLAMRCTRVSAGCANCWHLRMANRLGGNIRSSFPPEIRDAYAGGKPVLVAHKLTEPLRRKKPTVYGVQFMGDLFHADVLFGDICRVFDVIARCPQHTFLNFTKRPEIMARDVTAIINGPKSGEPLPNFVAGTSIENQATANERIVYLLRCPVACRVLSVEPMLGPIVLPSLGFTGPQTMVDGVICGGETGPGARPMHPDWVRGLRDQCVGVPFFFKSWGTGDKSLSGRLLDGRTWDELAWERKEQPA